MKREKQVEFVRLVQEGLKKQKSRNDADGITQQIDASRYTSIERLKEEKEVIFKNHPVVLGAAAQLKSAGDYFLHDEAELPILVIKGADGVIRALLNMCRHRGVRLLEDKIGHVKRNIVCPYHAWSYDNQGCLKGIFHPQGFKDVNAESHSLIELDCWVRLGMVFVVPNPEKKGVFDIDDWLKEAYSICEGFDFGDFIPYYNNTGILQCNWKLLVDGALEGYHFKIAHAETIGPYFLDNLSVPTDNKLHSSIVFPKRAMKKVIDNIEGEWNYRKLANTLLHIFPNTIVLIEPDHLMVVTFFPIDEQTTSSKSFMLLPTEPQTEDQKKYWDLNGRIFWDAIKEDNEMAELQQKSFSKYSDISMTVGSYESLLVQFENLVDKILLSGSKSRTYLI